MKKFLRLIMAFTLGFAFYQGNSQPTVTQLIYPQYCTDSSTAGRLPYVFRARIGGLTANSVYRYYTRAANLKIDGANASSGACIIIKNSNFLYITNPGFGGGGGQSDSIRTDATGSYTGWFAFEPVRGNTIRFAAGEYIHPRIYLLPLAGPPNPTVLTVADSILVTRLGTSSTNGTGVYSTSLAPSKDIVFLYDNTAGTGRPLTGSWIETDGLNFKSGTGLGGTPNAASYPDYYRNEVDTIASAWGAFIPNNLSTGLRRIERRSLTAGTISWADTDADGVWTTGNVNTVNPAGGASSSISISTMDAPLINTSPTVYFTNATQTLIENAGTVSISVGLKYPNANATSVDIIASGGNASGSSDYTFTTQTITFPANSTTAQNVTLSITNDATVESTEYLLLKMTNLTNGSIQGSPAADSIVIVDDDAPYVSFGAATGSGLESVTGPVIPVNIQFPNSNATSVNVAVTGGTATSGTDYTFTNQTLTFPASSSATINLPLTIINDAAQEANETIVFTLSNVTNGASLGIATFTYTITNDDIVPNLTFRIPTTQTIKENAGSVTVQVVLTNPAATATSITISGYAGSATLGADYTLPSSTLTFAANTQGGQVYTFPVTDDALMEGTENIILRLTNPSIPVNYINEYDTVIINDNDLPNYTISQIKKLDGLGVADSMAVRCNLHGVVHGPNVRPAGYQFFLHDGTGGIMVYRANGTFGFNVNEGDSVMVAGEVTQNNGELMFINLDTIVRLGTGKKLRTPVVVASLTEASEGEYITLQYAHIVNAASWPTGAAGQNGATVAVIDQNGRTYNTQIYRQTDIDSTQPTPYWFHISGIVAQSDNLLPWDSNYYIVPLHMSDYTLIYPKISFSAASDSVSESIGLDSVEVNLQWAARTTTSATVSFTGGSATFGQDFNFTSASVSFANGFAVNAKQKIGVIIIDDMTMEPDETIQLSILGPNNNATAVSPSVHTLVIRANDGAGINNMNAKGSMNVYPNPSSGKINIRTSERVNTVRITDMQGRQLGEWNSSTLELGNYAKGVYMLEIHTDKGVYLNRIVIE
jgi:hypothetical protein